MIAGFPFVEMFLDNQRFTIIRIHWLKMSKLYQSIQTAGWVNKSNRYPIYTENNIWPRGLPLQEILTPPPAWDTLTSSRNRLPLYNKV